MSHLICKLFTLINAGNISEAQSLLTAPAASLDACVAGSSESDADSDEDDDDGMQDAASASCREPEIVNLTQEQQADIEDGWGVVVRTTRGRRKEVVGGMDQC